MHPGYHQLVQLLEFLLECVSTPLEAQTSQTFSKFLLDTNVSLCCSNKSRLYPLSLAMLIVLINVSISLLTSGAFWSYNYNIVCHFFRKFRINKVMKFVILALKKSKRLLSVIPQILREGINSDSVSFIWRWREFAVPVAFIINNKIAKEF